MYKYLFFDDQKLLQRDGLERVYGKPKLVKDSVHSLTTQLQFVVELFNLKEMKMVQLKIQGSSTTLQVLKVEL